MLGGQTMIVEHKLSHRSVWCWVDRAGYAGLFCLDGGFEWLHGQMFLNVTYL